MKISKEIKAGLIGVFAIVGFYIMFQFMKGKNLFSSEHIYYAVFDDVQGLEASSPVSINGLKVGQVVSIKPNFAKDGKLNFIVQVRIDNQYSFSKKSTLEIFESGLIAGTAMKINLDYGQPFAKNGDTLKSGKQLSMLEGLTSQVAPVKDQLQVLLKTIDSVGNNANQLLNAQNQAEIRALLINLNKTVSSFDKTALSVQNLIENNDTKLQKTLDNAAELTSSGKSTIEKYGKLAESIDTQQLNQTISNLSKLSENLNLLVSGLQKGEGSLGKLMKDETLYKNLSATSDNLNQLVEDLKTNPKRYINISVFGKK